MRAKNPSDFGQGRQSRVYSFVDARGFIWLTSRRGRAREVYLDANGTASCWLPDRWADPEGDGGCLATYVEVPQALRWLAWGRT